MVYIRLTAFQVNEIKASDWKIDFLAFCLYKNIAKQGVATCQNKMTDYRAKIF